MTPPLTVAIAGYSGSGKTALIERIVPRLVERGLTVGYLKAGAHGVDADDSGKDTGRIRGAGASAVMALTAAESRFGVDEAHGVSAHEAMDKFPSERDKALFEHVSRCALMNAREHFAGCDLLLVEGMKFSALPKILVNRAGNPRGRLPRETVRRVLVQIELESGENPDMHADSAAEIILDLLASHRRMVSAGIAGAVLAGGESSRLGRDKALLPVGVTGEGGRPAGTWLERAFCLLAGLCGRVVIAGRAAAPGSAGLPLLKCEVESFADLRPGAGPLAGIETALRATRCEACLVMPCDMPVVREEMIELLLARRGENAALSAFRSMSGTGHPFPAVYGRAALGPLTDYLDNGGRKVLDFMGSIEPHWIDLPGDLDRLLINVNTPEDLARLEADRAG